MKNNAETPQLKPRKFPSALQIATSIYALLYLIFILDIFFPINEFKYPLKKTGEDLRGFSHNIHDIQFNPWISIRKPRRSGFCLILLRGYEFNPHDLETIVVCLLFVVFLVGYYFSWKNEGLAGFIFIFWWFGMWYLVLFVVETDRGAGVVMGFPLFILSILFIVSGYRKSHQSG